MFGTLSGIYAFTRILSPRNLGSYAFVMSIMLFVQSGLDRPGSKRFFERGAHPDGLRNMVATSLAATGSHPTTAHLNREWL